MTKPKITNASHEDDLKILNMDYLSKVWDMELTHIKKDIESHAMK